MPQNEVVSLKEYLESIPNSAILFILRTFAGEALDTQVVTSDEIKFKSSRTISASFVVDQLLTQKMVPGMYRLFAYIAQPKEGITEPKKVQDYILNKCLTEKGIKIKVIGELDSPSVGV
jgi:hypothetical protein